MNRHTGKIIWELGGRQSTFKLMAAPGQVLDSAGEIFAFQHDPEAIGNGEYTFFDDESDGSTRLLPPQPGRHREAGSDDQGGDPGEVR